MLEQVEKLKAFAIRETAAHRDRAAGLLTKKEARLLQHVTALPYGTALWTKLMGLYLEKDLPDLSTMDVPQGAGVVVYITSQGGSHNYPVGGCAMTLKNEFNEMLSAGNPRGRGSADAYIGNHMQSLPGQRRLATEEEISQWFTELGATLVAHGHFIFV